MNFSASRSKAAVAETTFISDSGVYDVTIKFASVDTAASGAKSINFNVDYNGSSQTLYGFNVQKINGDTNEIGAKLVNALAIIADMADGEEYIIEEETHPVGKDQTPREFAVVQQFSDLAIKVRLQEEYSVYQGKTGKKLVIKSFFSEEGASAKEIIDGTEAGARLALETEKYASNVTYKDGLTPEAVAEWKADKAGGRASTPTPKASSAPKKKLFG